MIDAMHDAGKARYERLGAYTDSDRRNLAAVRSRKAAALRVQLERDRDRRNAERERRRERERLARRNELARRREAIYRNRFAAIAARVLAAAGLRTTPPKGLDARRRWADRGDAAMQADPEYRSLQERKRAKEGQIEKCKGRAHERLLLASIARARAAS